MRWMCFFALVASACGNDDLDFGNADLSGTADDGGSGLLVIAPADTTVTIQNGQITTVQYTATYNGSAVQPQWSIDRGEIGSIDGSGLLTPTGKVGGTAKVSATFAGLMVGTTVTVQLETSQSGDPAANGPIVIGAGGYGGVGGDGPGKTPTMQQTQVLNGTPMADATVKMIYPYDGTVWPRGLLAPLLQWDPGAHTFDSVYVHVTEKNLDYKGYFAKPAATTFKNLPIPQDAWRQMTYSNSGDDLVVTITFAQGAQAYGPYTLKFKVAPATLKGTVYYNSYGTKLTTPAGQAATLAIKPGASDPTIVSAPDKCRVCHSVAANGTSLVTQRGEDYPASDSINLAMNNQATALTQKKFAFPAVYPDGTMFFSATGNSTWWNDAAASSALYSLPAQTLIATTGLPAGLKALFPSFSTDGKHIAFTYWGGTDADQRTLASIDFDNTNKVFSNFQKLVTPANMKPAVWPSFLPENDRLVYEVETAGPTGNGAFLGTGATWSNARGELWWVDLASKTAHRLDKLNGVGYLPTGPSNHSDDTTLNYEPTVNPTSSGGYAWVVFTSRRLYGNVAVGDPWGGGALNNKKLWVAAVDLNAAPGTDPSHPAFYLPGQEQAALNSRGFWAIDPCHPNGTSCETGDECCGGYCRSGDGGLVCGDQSTCVQQGGPCVVNDDCCGSKEGVTCVGGSCGQAIP